MTTSKRTVVPLRPGGTDRSRVREAVRRAPDDHRVPLTALRSDADEALRDGPWSVMQKQHVPPRGDKHLLWE